MCRPAAASCRADYRPTTRRIFHAKRTTCHRDTDSANKVPQIRSHDQQVAAMVALRTGASLFPETWGVATLVVFRACVGFLWLAPFWRSSFPPSARPPTGRPRSRQFEPRVGVRGNPRFPLPEPPTFAFAMVVRDGCYRAHRGLVRSPSPICPQGHYREGLDQ